jgi:RNA polymerase sigma factor (sigma-70 family)
MSESDAVVFIVDDDESVRRSLSRLLRSVGLDVEAYHSAQAFLDCDRPDSPCCLVLDVRMPGLSGLDLQEELNRRGWALPIIIITGHGDVPMSVRAMKLGATDFLQKPFRDQALLDVIRPAIEKDREARQQQADVADIKRRMALLTPREREVFTLVVSGMLNKQIAYKLGIAEKTVKVHRARAMDKMQANSLADLVHMADRIGVVPPKD